MIQINDTVQFEESKNLSKQTPEFKTWYNQNVIVLINDKLVPDILDEYKRPKSYTVKVETFSITIYPLYIYNDQSNWVCSDFQLTIKSV